MVREAKHKEAKRKAERRGKERGKHRRAPSKFGGTCRLHVIKEGGGPVLLIRYILVSGAYFVIGLNIAIKV